MSLILGVLGCVILPSLVLMVMKFKKKTTKSFKTTSNPSIVRLDITKNISLLSNKKKTNCTITDFRLDQKQEKPLVVLACWMNAQTKHKYKFAEFWIEKGFDVLTITISAWHLLLPIMGSQIVAADVLRFLDQNRSYSQIIVHGFSVSGYQWGEVLVHMNKNIDRYQQILDKIVGQIWDSIADVEEIPSGLPIALFPENKFVAFALHKYLLFHLRTFDQIATRHYMKSSQLFHSDIVKAPALIFVSKTDPIGNVRTNQRLMGDWKRRGIKVHWKVFEKSPHVGHFLKHRKEYVSEINTFLTGLNFNQHAQIQSPNTMPNRKARK